MTVDEDDIHVLLAVDGGKIRLSTGGTEIGEWPAEDCSIDDAGNGVFTITVENETLQFVPNNPMTFATAMNGGSVPDRRPEPDPEVTETLTSVSDADEAPPAKPVTMVVFYALAGITGFFGLWALISLFI